MLQKEAKNVFGKKKESHDDWFCEHNDEIQNWWRKRNLIEKL